MAAEQLTDTYEPYYHVAMVNGEMVLFASVEWRVGEEPDVLVIGGNTYVRAEPDEHGE